MAEVGCFCAIPAAAGKKTGVGNDMDAVAGFFIVAQLLLMLAAAFLFLMSRQRTRVRRANRESHRLLAIFLAIMAFFVSLPSVLVDNAESRFDATLVLFLGAVVAILCGLVIHRSFVAGAPHRRPAKP